MTISDLSLLADYANTAVLAACRTLVVESENRPRRGRFLPDSPPHGYFMRQETGKKGAGAVDLQPTIPKSDRLLGKSNELGENLYQTKRTSMMPRETTLPFET
jgi:hypothetical protein